MRPSYADFTASSRSLELMSDVSWGLRQTCSAPPSQARPSLIAPPDLRCFG